MGVERQSHERSVAQEQQLPRAGTLRLDVRGSDRRGQQWLGVLLDRRDVQPPHIGSVFFRHRQSLRRRNLRSLSEVKLFERLQSRQLCVANSIANGPEPMLRMAELQLAWLTR